MYCTPPPQVCKKHQADWDLLKLLAVLFVVIGHIGYVSFQSSYGGIDYFSLVNANKVLNFVPWYLVGLIYLFHMPLFVFISGALYYLTRSQIEKCEHFSIFLEKKVRTLLIPYFTCAIFYMIPIRIITTYYNSSDFVKVIGYGVFLGLDNGHLWFLLMLFNLFMIFYSVENVLKKSTIFFNVIFLILINVVSYKLPTNIFFFAASIRYVVFFYIGYIFQQHKEEILKILNKRKLIYLVLGFAYFMFLYFYLTSAIVPTMSVTFKILKVIGSLCGILFSYLLILNLANEEVVNNKIVKFLNRHKFRIYLFHDPINYVVLMFFAKYGWLTRMTQTEVGSFVYLLMRFSLTLLLPCFLSSLLNKFKGGYRISQTRDSISAPDLTCKRENGRNGVTLMLKSGIKHYGYKIYYLVRKTLPIYGL
jgi:fucose 4-O-acetylase-like acetyltransferase